jgi:hypothetical protein
LASQLAVPASRASCLLTRMGIGFFPGSTFAPTGLEGFRPAFLLFARMRFLSRQPAVNKISHFAAADTIYVVTGRAKTIPKGRIPWQRQQRQSNQA